MKRFGITYICGFKFNVLHVRNQNYLFLDEISSKFQRTINSLRKDFINLGIKGYKLTDCTNVAFNNFVQSKLKITKKVIHMVEFEKGSAYIADLIMKRLYFKDHNFLKNETNHNVWNDLAGAHYLMSFHNSDK